MADDMDIDIDFANDPDMQQFEEEEARAQVCCRKWCRHIQPITLYEGNSDSAVDRSSKHPSR